MKTRWREEMPKNCVCCSSHWLCLREISGQRNVAHMTHICYANEWTKELTFNNADQKDTHEQEHTIIISFFFFFVRLAFVVSFYAKFDLNYFWCDIYKGMCYFSISIYVYKDRNMNTVTAATAAAVAFVHGNRHDMNEGNTKKDNENAAECGGYFA